MSKQFFPRGCFDSNDLVSVRRSLIAAIRKQKRKNLGNGILKYCYIGNGAKSYLELTRSKGYTTPQREYEILCRGSKELKTALGKIYPFTLFSLGIGNGIKEAAILEMLSSFPVIEKFPISFAAVDISMEMLMRSHEVIKRLGIPISLEHYYQHDFQTQEFSELVFQFSDSAPYTRFVFSIMGNTLANMEDPFDFLHITPTSFGDFFRRVFTRFPDFYFLVSLELRPEGDGEKIISAYTGAEDLSFLSGPLELLGLGKKDAELEVIFNKKKKRIEAHYKFKQGVQLDDKFALESGETVLVGFSYKFTYEELMRLIRSAGFSIELELLNTEKNHIIVLLKQKECPSGFPRIWGG